MPEIESLIAQLPPASFWLLGFVFILIVLQEGINGFHDTANAVTTVIYSSSLVRLVRFACSPGSCLD